MSVKLLPTAPRRSVHETPRYRHFTPYLEPSNLSSGPIPCYPGVSATSAGLTPNRVERGAIIAVIREVPVSVCRTLKSSDNPSEPRAIRTPITPAETNVVYATECDNK